MPCGHRAAQFSGRTAHVAQGPVGTEVEYFGEGLEVWPGDAAHRADELLEGCGVTVELVEHWATVLFGLVLGRSGPQRFFQVVPQGERSLVVELEDPANVSVPAAYQAVGACRRAGVPCSGAVGVAHE